MNALTLWFHKLGSPPIFDRIAGRIQPWCFALAIVLGAVGLYGGLVMAPADYQQGDAFRIIYIHVPSAWMSLFIYFVMGVNAFIALVWRIKLSETLAMACAPVGAAFTFVCLVTGSLWGKPTWGTWWVWDARLTSMLVLFFFYAGHMALSHAFDDEQRGARAAAVLALVGVINLPIIKFSVDWWYTLHQPESILRAGGPTIHSSLLTPLLIMALGFLCYFIAVFLLRIEVGLAGRRLETQTRLIGRPY